MLDNFAAILSKYVLLLALLISGCATLPDNSTKPTSYAISDSQSTGIGLAVADDLQAHPGQSGFSLLTNGLDAFAARAVLARAAERSLDVQYYFIHDDLVGRLFMDLLLEAANRDVRVRILVDDIHVTERAQTLLALAAHPNISVRTFNPFSRNLPRAWQYVSRLDEINRRMHNKAFIADNQGAIVGGRNIGDEYFAADPDFAFGDLDLLTFGPVVTQASHSFDQYWNSEYAYPLQLLTDEPSSSQVKAIYQKLKKHADTQAGSAYVKAIAESELIEQLSDSSLKLYWGAANFVADAPQKIDPDIAIDENALPALVEREFLNAESEIIVFTPYFVPGDYGVDGLSKLVAQGVEVKVLTNSLASIDHVIVHAHYAKYRRALLASGIKLFEVKASSDNRIESAKKFIGDSQAGALHGKAFVIDRNRIFVGSLNFDPRSFNANSELGIVFESSELAAVIARWFDINAPKVAYQVALNEDARNGKMTWSTLENGEPIIFESEPDASCWDKTKMLFFRLLPVEPLL